jgi:hypothetical protein
MPLSRVSAPFKSEGEFHHLEWEPVFSLRVQTVRTLVMPIGSSAGAPAGSPEKKFDSPGSAVRDQIHFHEAGTKRLLPVGEGADRNYLAHTVRRR